jgi:hypothetical protein
MEVWKSRDLTYEGNILILKSLVLSLIGYEIEMRGIPEKYEREINNFSELLFGMGKQTKFREIYVVYQKKKGEWEWSILKIL